MALSTDKSSKPYVRYLPFVPNGEVNIPPSKSDVHRAIICAALTRGKCTIAPVALSNDIKATIGVIEDMGCTASIKDGVLTVDGTNIFKTDNVTLDCGESGSTLRLLLPIAGALGKHCRFAGKGRLPERPIGVLLDEMARHGCKADSDHLPVTLEGKLRSGVYTLPGNVSSQFITGLLFALPLLEGESEIRLTTKIESKGYIDMTLKTLKTFGITVTETESGWSIPGGQKYHGPRMRYAEGDWSNAAFWLVAGAAAASAVRGWIWNLPKGIGRLPLFWRNLARKQGLR